jgi:hypothetical protein
LDNEGWSLRNEAKDISPNGSSVIVIVVGVDDEVVADVIVGASRLPSSDNDALVVVVVAVVGVAVAGDEETAEIGVVVLDGFGLLSLSFALVTAIQ